jgi:hypothetical protein
MSNDKEGACMQEIWAAPTQKAEYDTASLSHGLCVSGGSIYNKDTNQNTLSYPLLAFTMIDPATGWIEIVKATNRPATSIQDLFHNTWLARYPRPQFIVFDNGNIGEFKREFKQMCDNHAQHTSHKQMQSLIENTKLSMTCSDHLTWKMKASMKI